MNDQLSQRDYEVLVRADFHLFVQRVFRHLESGTAYLDNWHIEHIARHLEIVFDGRCTRVIINLPPRAMKSIIAWRPVRIR